MNESVVNHTSSNWQVACVLMFNLQKDDFPVDTHVSNIQSSNGVHISDESVILFLQGHWKILILQHVCRSLRLRSSSVGSQMRRTGTKHTFISTKGSLVISNLISTVFFTHTASSVRNVRRERAPDKERDPKISLVPC